MTFLFVFFAVFFILATVVGPAMKIEDRPGLQVAGQEAAPDDLDRREVGVQIAEHRGVHLRALRQEPASVVEVV